MLYNALEKLRDNITAIDIALHWDYGETMRVGDEEKLKKYTGFGGIKAILYPEGSEEEWRRMGATDADMRLYPDMMALHRLLHEGYGSQYEEVIRSLKNSVLTAFYIPAVIPQTLYRVLVQQGAEPRRMYEPSAGIGIFATEAAKAFPGLEDITAIDKDTVTALVLAAVLATVPTDRAATQAIDPKAEITPDIPFTNKVLNGKAALTDVVPAPA